MNLKQEYEQLQSGAIKFPDDCSKELLEAIIDRDDGIHKFQAQHELTIRRCGRTLIAVQAEDENGEIIMNPNGKPKLDFVYTKGNVRRDYPEVIIFYPSQTIGFALNKLCDKIESGEVTAPKNGKSVGVKGCFEDESLQLVITPIHGKARKVAADTYACQLDDDDPLLLAFAPLPNGDFRPEFVPDAILPF